PGIKVEFSADEIRADNGFDLKISVPPNTQTKTYPLIITGTASPTGKIRTTTLQIAVLSNVPYVGVPQNISNSSGDSSRPRLMVDNKGITHLMWQDDTEGATQIFYSRSLDGESFSQPLDISRSFFSVARPNWAIDTNGRIHIVWEERRSDTSFIIYTRSDDGGETFTATRIVSPGIDIAFDASLTIAPNGGVYLIYSGKTNADAQASAIFMTRSFDGGDTFSSPQQVVSSIPNEEIFFEPTIAVDTAGVIHIAYSAMILTGKKFGSPIFRSSVSYTRSSDEGENFSEPIKLFDNAPFADSPVLLID